MDNIYTKKMNSQTRLNETFIDVLERLSTLMMKKGEIMRSRAYTKAQETIMSITGDITSVDQIKGLPNIGSTITEKLTEYLNTGTLALLEREKNNPILIFTDIYGVGPKKAKELVDKNVTTLSQLRDNQQTLLNDVQRVGLRYYEDILKRIPRAEIDEYDGLFKRALEKVHTPGSTYEIVGSYRRGAANSGDIDVILTSPDPATFTAFVDELKREKVILEILSRGKSKCLTITQLNNTSVARRVDFLYTKPEEYPFAVLYFTGSKSFNTLMRSVALKQGFSLNEYGLYKKEAGKEKEEKVNHVFNTEADIFDFLGLEYKPPNMRLDGRYVVMKGVPAATTSLQSVPVQALLKEKKTRKKASGERKPRAKKTLKVASPKIPSPIPQLLKPVSPKPVSLEPSIPARTEVIVPVKEKKTRKKRSGERKPRAKKTLKEAVAEKVPSPIPLSLKPLSPKPPSPKPPSPKPPSPKPPSPKPIISKEKKTRKRKSGERKSVTNNIKTSIEEPVSIACFEVMQNIQIFKEKGITHLEKLKEQELEDMIKAANTIYTNTKQSLMTDNEYDILREYVEKKHPKNPVLEQIGAPALEGKKNKVTLPYQMPSMDKIKPDTNALATWMNKYKGPYVISCKLDGVSGMYSLEGSQPKLYTRGDGKVGQDITDLLKALKLPQASAIKEKIVVRGEFILPKKLFDEKYKATFANPRNLVSGIINSKKIDEKAKDLHFVAYEIISPPMKPSEQMTKLRELGFEVVRNQVEPTLSNEVLSTLLMDWRSNYEYEIDGIIVADDKVYKREEGNPEHAFAFKMVISDQIAEAKVVDVIWTPSKSGYLKPRVRIEPIKIGGVTIEYATGFNGKFIESNKIGIGALIQLTRSGDVIPHILSVITPAEKAKMPEEPYHWTDTHIDVVLDNIAEDEVVLSKNITDFFKGIEVDGLSSGNVKRIMNAGFNSVAKIIKMNKQDFEAVEGFQKKMIDKIYEGIREKIEKASLLDIMVASNLFGRGMGERKIKPIIEAYPDILRDKNSTPDQKMEALMKISGIGKENAKSFVENIPRFLEFLEETGLETKLTGKSNPIVSSKEEVVVISDTSHPLYQKHIVMTKVRDKKIIEELKRVGGILDDSMGKNTFVLIVKSHEDESNKTKYAKEHGIPIMTPAEFISNFIM